MIYTDAVAAGAALLDAKRPEWASQIDTMILDMADGDRCILGQLSGDYSSAVAWLEIDFGSDFGFNLPNDDYFAPDIDARWAWLHELWVGEIDARTPADRC